MAEIAAVSLAAAIIEIGIFAKKVVDRCKEFRSRSKDVPKAFRTISVQLPLVVSSLEQIRDQTGEASLTPLKPVIEACHEEVKYLEAILDRILPAPGASRWERDALAVRSMRHDSEIKKSIANLQSNMNLLLCNVSFRASYVLQQLRSDGEYHEVISLIRQVGRLAAQPSLLKDLLDKLEATQSPSDSSIAADPGNENALVPQEYSLQQTPFSEAQNPFTTENFERTCTCKRPRVEQSWTRPIFSGTFRSASIQRHRRGCLLFREEDKVTKMTFNTSFISRLANTAASLSLSLQFGAGGMSVSPSLTLRGMKRPESEVFKLMKVVGQPWYCHDDWTPRMEWVLPKIKDLILSGKASPYDIDQDGRTVFDYLMDPFAIPPGISEPRFREPRQFFIKSLCSLGFPANEESDVGTFGKGTILDKIVRVHLEAGRVPDSNSIAELINLGAAFGEDPQHLTDWLKNRVGEYGVFGFLPRYNWSTLPIHSIGTIAEFADRCNCNALQFAILERSASKIERYLRYHPEMVSVQNLLGQTPLHLAAYWPWACQTLLDAGADPLIPDFLADFPLSYACFQHCSESVKILLAGDSPLSHSCSELSVLNHIFATVSDKDIHAVLIDGLASRRKELLITSLRVLPRPVFEELAGSSGALPDIEAFSLIKALRDAGDVVDPNYWCYTSFSVYELENFTTEIAELLFAAGFTDLEGKGKPGLTLLLRSAMRIPGDKSIGRTQGLARIHWLLSKGVSLRKHVETKALSDWLIPSVNVVSAMLGRMMGFIYNNKNDSDITKELLRQVLGSHYQNCQDLCKCQCSMRGCTPLITFLKGFSRASEGHLRTDKDHGHRERLVNRVMQILALDITASEIIGMTNSALRFCLFEDLELRHVCCRVMATSIAYQDLLPPIDAEEAQELQEEDKSRMQKFHELLPKAELQYHQSSKSFSEFWPKFYDDNIASRPSDGSVNIAIQGMVELGIQVHEIDEGVRELNIDEPRIMEVSSDSE